MYEGHMPNGSPVQKHSVGDLYPVIIVGYGTWQWVDPSRRAAGVVRWSTQERCVAAARMYINTVRIAQPSEGCRRSYEEYIRGNIS